MMKYATALLMAAAVVILGWSMVAFVRPPLQMVAPRADRSATAPKAAAEALVRIGVLESSLARIQRLTSSMPLPPLAVADDVAATANSVGSVKSAAPAAEPQVSLLYLSSNMQRAVVDGQLVAVGDSFASGDRVLAIHADKIVLDSKGRRKTLPVPPPHIVGGVASQPRGAAK